MSIAVQLLFNSLVSGLVLAVMAVGFHLAFRTAKVFHLAHGAVFVTGAYLYLLVRGDAAAMRLPALAAVLMGGAVLAWLMHILVYQPLERRRAGQEMSLIASMGLYMLVVEGLALAFGNQARMVGGDGSESLSMGAMMIAPAQGTQLLAAGAALLFTVRLLHGERGLPFRAVMSQPTVATVLGVNARLVRAGAMALSGALAALTGALLVIDIGIHPHAGLGITLSAAVAVILGGARSLPGTIAAAVLLALLQTGTEWFLGAHWKEGITFLILIGVLLWKTEGIVAFNLRPEER